MNDGSLYQQFLVPPFSILDARSRWWGDRKKDWLALGFNSVEGRDAGMIFAPVRTCSVYKKREDMAAELGRDVEWDEFYAANPEYVSNGTSAFDPNLVEFLVNWFSPRGGTVLDPFAGGSVRGIVTAAVGRAYTGVDLSASQIGANVTQWSTIRHRMPGATPPRWINGDSADLKKHVGGKFDMVLSCPPYHDLEVYSDNPADISNMSYTDFLETYRAIIAQTVDAMADDSFAVFVVGDLRDKSGMLRNFVSDTASAFIDAGAPLYNEIIYITPYGTLPIRVAMQMNKSRKIGKTHQNILVFVKGDPVKATAKIGDSVVNFFDAEEVTTLDDMFA